MTTPALVDLTALAKTHRPEDNAILLEAFRKARSLSEMDWFERVAPHAIYARLNCPHCGVPFSRPPGILGQKCPRCREQIYVKTVDGLRYLLRLKDIGALKAWTEENGEVPGFVREPQIT